MFQALAEGQGTGNEEEEDIGGVSEDEGSEEGADRGNEGEDILCEHIKEEDQEDMEARVAKARGNTKEPTQKEIDEHTLTHIPFRSWCAHCVRGKAKNNPPYKNNRRHRCNPNGEY